MYPAAIIKAFLPQITKHLPDIDNKLLEIKKQIQLEPGETDSIFIFYESTDNAGKDYVICAFATINDQNHIMRIIEPMRLTEFIENLLKNI